MAKASPENLKRRPVTNWSNSFSNLFFELNLKIQSHFIRNIIANNVNMKSTVSIVKYLYYVAKVTKSPLKENSGKSIQRVASGTAKTALMLKCLNHGI